MVNISLTTADVPLILGIVVHEYYEAVLERVRDIVML
jgi:hypothetical protein